MAMEEVSNSVAGVSVHGPVSATSSPVLQPGACFCDIVQGVSAPPSSSFLVHEAPSLDIPMGQYVEEEEEYYRSVSLVCHFNGLWPKLVNLNRWISATWIPVMQQESFIHPCAKYFFIVEFNLREDRDLIFNSGSWFWGNSGLFMKPWSPSFNLATDILSSALVWVRLPNLPLHFWGLPSLKAIGSALGKFHFANRETTRNNTSTFSRICVEMDFGKGFPVEVILTSKKYSWPHKLDFEIVSLHCRSCFETGHLASHCPKG
jgi:hypothetical protein